MRAHWVRADGLPDFYYAWIGHHEVPITPRTTNPPQTSVGMALDEYRIQYLFGMSHSSCLPACLLAWLACLHLSSPPLSSMIQGR